MWTDGQTENNSNTLSGLTDQKVKTQNINTIFKFTGICYPIETLCDMQIRVKFKLQLSKESAKNRPFLADADADADSLKNGRFWPMPMPMPINRHIPNVGY